MFSELHLDFLLSVLLLDLMFDVFSVMFGLIGLLVLLQDTPTVYSKMCLYFYILHQKKHGECKLLHPSVYLNTGL